ncbi:DUF6690 family protein [Novipirellula artificiosorum]|uniref:DUF6690 domain-containing protein n=1 Tax=Novipirellula artificiosorum TaxID=2528016 RepID=A0A5C6DDL0_9BACT|nr:DUF6690 family protein [Novipirellula artificiosorum]TWU33781.1 hypothetical protein Poly41_47790 [Novipirellula artificiosorum]
MDPSPQYHGRVMSLLTPLRNAAIVVVLVGGPYAASETEFGRDAITKIKQSFASSDGSDGLTLASTSSGTLHSHYELEQLRRADPDRYRYDGATARRLGALPSNEEEEPQLVGSTVQDIREVLRFDISPDWVLQRFSRVSTVLADLHMEGLRVPIVTGTRADDLAGTLTYYFDPNGKVQRVSIHGFTGDPNRIAGIMIGYYGLKREPSLEAGVFTRRWNGTPVQFMRLTHAPVVYSDAVHQKFTVFVELNEPSLAYGISPEAQRIVQSDRHSGRW